MVRKIRFPLEMENGIEVRSMEELRDNFSVLKVMDYLKTGRLLIWLRDRYLNEEADAVKELNPEDPECAKKLCAIFAVPYDGVDDILKGYAIRKERLHRLKQYTDKKEYESLIDQTAFDQDELYDLLDAETKEIYLCGERFHIPLSQPGITYIGINSPLAVIDSKEEVDWKKKQIAVQNVVFNHEYQEVLKKSRKKKEAAAETMVCIDMDNKALYKWNMFKEKYDLFYKFQEPDLYYLNVVRDKNYLYFLRHKGPHSKSKELVSVSLKDKAVTSLFDFNQKDSFDLLCVRNGNLFLKGQQHSYSFRLLRINLQSKEEKMYMLNSFTQDILIDETGENAYIRVRFSARSFDEIYRYEFKSEKQTIILKQYNVLGMDLMNGYLLIWGKDTSKNLEQQFYYYIYDTRSGKKKEHRGGTEFCTHALWRNTEKEYRMKAPAFYETTEKYPIYETSLSTGQTGEICELRKPYISTDEIIKKFGRHLRIHNGYLYLLCTNDDLDGSGAGIEYEVNNIPYYRIRLSDYQLQKYNGTRYVVTVL